MNVRTMLRKAGFPVCVALSLFACGQAGLGTGTTLEEDYTLGVSVADRFLDVGDQTALFVNLKRTDNSNLPKDLKGVILITTSAHGQTSESELRFEVGDATTGGFQAHVVFTAHQPGVAEVRMAFRDAVVLAEILISEGNL